MKCRQNYRLTLEGGCAFEPGDPNCKEFMNDQCRACITRYVLTSMFTCKPVDPQCKDYDPNSGYCMSCYWGYSIQGTRCLPEVTPSPQGPSQAPSAGNLINSSAQIGSSLPVVSTASLSQDINCAKSGSNGDCEKCSFGFYKSGKSCLKIS